LEEVNNYHYIALLYTGNQHSIIKYKEKIGNESIMEVNVPVDKFTPCLIHTGRSILWR